jgi:hypothetical protein
VYATDVYSESPPRKSASPWTKKRFKDQLEADIDSLSSHRSDPEVWNAAGKTPEEIVAWCAEYERDTSDPNHIAGPGRPLPTTAMKAESNSKEKYAYFSCWLEQ